MPNAACIPRTNLSPIPSFQLTNSLLVVAKESIHWVLLGMLGKLQVHRIQRNQCEKYLRQELDHSRSLNPKKRSFCIGIGAFFFSHKPQHPTGNNNEEFTFALGLSRALDARIPHHLKNYAHHLIAQNAHFCFGITFYSH